MITKIFTPKNILIALLVLAVIYLAMCNKPKPIDIPSTVPVKEQEKTVAKIDKAKENSDDSIKALLKFKDDEINRYYNKWQATDIKLTQAERVIDGILNEVVPDTCLEITNKLKGGFVALKTETDNYRKDATKTIGSLQSKINTQASFLSKKDSDYKKIRLALDTCFINAKVSEKTIKDLKPRNKLAIGIVGNVFPVIGYGVGADFISRKGIVFSGSAMVMNNQSYIAVGLKKVISFRK